MTATEHTAHEFERILNLVPSKDIERDWRLGDAVASGELRALGALPPSHDLRTDWWTVGDQEDTGSCVGWATGDGVMRYHLVTAELIGSNERVSPRFIWMGSKETDTFTQHPQTFIERSGTTLKAAVDICHRFGTVTEDVLPFHISTKMYVGGEPPFWAKAAQRRIRYYNLGTNLTTWKQWLVDTGPILAGFSVDDSWMDATAQAGLIDTFQPHTVRGGHAIAVVGYRADGRFILRNSWGTNWGDNGFAYVSPDYIADAFFSESYGVKL